MTRTVSNTGVSALTVAVDAHNDKRSGRWAVCLGIWSLSLLASAAASQTVPQTSSETPPAYSGYPKWSEFPPPPQNVPTPAEIKVQVAEIYAQEKTLLAQVAAINWDREKPDIFSQSTIARLDPELSRPVVDQNIREMAERFAAEQRARAVPPPLLD